MKNKLISLLAYLILILNVACSTKSSFSNNQWFLASWEKLSSNKAYNIEWADDPDGTQNKVLKFEVRAEDAWSNHGKETYRAEIATNEFVPLNKKISYEFEIFIPSDFPIEDNRLVFAQWWPKTKKQLGEISRSPSMALRFVNQRLYATIRNSDIRVVKDPDNVPSKEIFEIQKFKLGRWHKFKFIVLWSYKNNGEAQILIDDNEIANYKGGIGYNDDIGPEFQFGIYRDKSMATYRVFFRNVKILVL